MPLVFTVPETQYSLMNTSTLDTLSLGSFRCRGVGWKFWSGTLEGGQAEDMDLEVSR